MEGVKATIFIRPVDPKKSVSPAEIVQESLAAIKQLEASGTYSKEEVLKTPEDPKNPGWSEGTFTARHQGVPVISHVYVTIKGDYAIKARVTTGNPFTDADQEFVTEFQRIVNESQPKP